MMGSGGTVNYLKLLFMSIKIFLGISKINLEFISLKMQETVLHFTQRPENTLLN